MTVRTTLAEALHQNCGVAKWTERSPTGTEVRQCSWDAAGASFGRVRAALGSHCRLPSFPSPLLSTPLLSHTAA